jgi:hypothetical protein
VLEELYPVTFTINPTPADATVIINGEERNTIEIMQLEEVNWSVTYDGYDSQTGSFIIYEDTLLEPTLDVEFDVWESSTPGTYSVDIKVAGNYQVILVGAGGGGASKGSKRMAGGGSGAYLNGIFALPSAIYSVVVGEGGLYAYSDSNNSGVRANDGGSSGIYWNEESMIVGGGKGGYAYSGSSGYELTPGTGGGKCSIPSTLTTISIESNENGNKGQTGTSLGSVGAGGASLYNGYGKGGIASSSSSSTYSGTNGYVCIKKIKD